MSRSTKIAPEIVETLAAAGLARRIRPLLDHASRVAGELFDLESRIQARTRSLLVFVAAFEATDQAFIQIEDRRVFERERRRRRRRIELLESRKAQLMQRYGEELLQALPRHPDLQELL